MLIFSCFYVFFFCYDYFCWLACFYYKSALVGFFRLGLILGAVFYNCLCPLSFVIQFFKSKALQMAFFTFKKVT